MNIQAQIAAHLAMVAAINARIEGYKAQNSRDVYQGSLPWYGEDYFQSAESDLVLLATQLQDLVADPKSDLNVVRPPVVVV
jgi:hypothetical protein